MKTQVCRALYLALTSAGISAIALTGAAHADRQGAPIRYAGQPSSQTAKPVIPAESQTARPSQATINADRRVEFLYPGETPTVSTPGVSAIAAMPTQSVASTPGKLVLDTAPKVAFAAPNLVGAATDLSETVTVPVTNPSAPQATAPSQPIRIASLSTNKPARTGTPLTLSRVQVNRDAPVGDERGKASIYTDGFDGAPTANGEIFDETAMTAAHPSLPLPSLVQVINEDNRREVVVRVNDRGPFGGQRILELSPRAGTVLGMTKGGTSNVRVRYLGPAPVKQNPATFASNRVEDESLPPVAKAPAPVMRDPMPVTPIADYGEPSLGVPDPVEPVRVSSQPVIGNVFIQAGAFADISNAQNLTRALDRGLSVRIEEARVNGGDYFRVLIGPFPTTDAAEVQRSQLSRAGIVDGFLTTR